jgi:hypothetical protein
VKGVNLNLNNLIEEKLESIFHRKIVKQQLNLKMKWENDNFSDSYTIQIGRHLNE